MADVDTNALGWVIAVVSFLAAFALLIGRLFTASRVYRTQVDSEKEFGYVYEHLKEIDCRDERQDAAIHSIQINYTRTIENLRHNTESMEKLTTAIETLVRESRHTPQCQLSSQTPNDPASRDWPEPKNQTRRNKTLRGDE